MLSEAMSRGIQHVSGRPRYWSSFQTFNCPPSARWDIEGIGNGPTTTVTVDGVSVRKDIPLQVGMNTIEVRYSCGRLTEEHTLTVHVALPRLLQE